MLPLSILIIKLVSYTERFSMSEILGEIQPQESPVDPADLHRALAAMYIEQDVMGTAGPDETADIVLGYD